MRPTAGRFDYEPGEREALAERERALAPALRTLVIALDGPAGSGKSTTARRVAARLGLRHLDTGSMYRALTLAAQRSAIALTDAGALSSLARALRFRIDSTPEHIRVFLDDEDVTHAVRSPEVTRAVSRVAALAPVRAVMVELQQKASTAGGVLLDGRDIGTVVLPHADVKVYLTANVEARALRRQAEEAGRAQQRPLDEIAHEIEQRDHDDSTRAASPLTCAADAVVLDTSDLTIDEQVDAVVTLAVRRATLGAIVDAREAGQPGYRALHNPTFRFVRALVRGLVHPWFGLRCELHPAARLPGSVLVACNHVSLLDPPLVATSLPFEVSFVAKQELFRKPWLGGLIRRLNAFPIRRGWADFESLDHAVELLQHGQSVLMFPEGTRQAPGTLGQARWGFGYVALRAARPVVPAFVRGTCDTRPRGLRHEPLEVWVGEPLHVAPQATADARAGYDAIGALVMQRIAGLMLRSAARTPLAGLDLPGAYRNAPTAPR